VYPALDAKLDTGRTVPSAALRVTERRKPESLNLQDGSLKPESLNLQDGRDLVLLERDVQRDLPGRDQALPEREDVRVVPATNHPVRVVSLVPTSLVV